MRSLQINSPLAVRRSLLGQESQPITWNQGGWVWSGLRTLFKCVSDKQNSKMSCSGGFLWSVKHCALQHPHVVKLIQERPGLLWGPLAPACSHSHTSKTPTSHSTDAFSSHLVIHSDVWSAFLHQYVIHRYSGKKNYVTLLKIIVFIVS